MPASKLRRLLGRTIVILIALAALVYLGMWLIGEYVIHTYLY